ncbi:hypothetical protein L596_014229 [Steinernema carpocapsae]|uniref:Uncharacterized protein n=1 Tax=Steinernema carpocapsae TaxID=34508 RepID=A0A4U5NC45_STECR|nr:hypothetical protein L596_014229 [Steinernema carpocapsae]
MHLSPGHVPYYRKTLTTVANSAFATLILTLSWLQNRPIRSDGEMRANANAAATVTRTCSVRDIASGTFCDRRTDMSGSFTFL